MSAAIFVLAIFAFLVVDIYHRARRASAAVGDKGNIRHYFLQLFSHRQPYQDSSTGSAARQDYYYTWQITRMLRVHMEDATMVFIYILVLLALCMFLGILLVQYWTIRCFQIWVNHLIPQGK
ncbi:hypothetical protein FGSG_11432 [Fusarium graminearum PH-1]|uniref:hypothetical protein n=1 Tax=Gibberella zeae (strain ATCC MYA-4620 / CBS 123657 / FGSC 9075 / NRRL 31084 / PH-1) TaxID=229533 RepID=UPI000023F6EC|nr:hypothetical protein FGSG_11432 [Fusarium graminearum PH-1]ESU18169.1 hypothetical protein FGSG_11432 [Fusarium graminearum PH-1]|eukprot:XP_011325791.1 hypothetical protein FGSG_11432 [Fusarium graminearum PH-1]